MKKLIILFALIALLAAGCAPATPSATPVVETNTPVPPRPTRTPTPIPPSTETPTVTPTFTPAAQMYAPVTFKAKIVCRMGPDEHYNPVVTYQIGETAELNGRNDDASWLMVAVTQKNKNSYCWVPVSSVETPGDTAGLNIVPFGKLPDSPLSMTATSGVCGSTSKPMILEWSPVAAGTGYRIIRNGKVIGSVYEGRFHDFDTPKAKQPYIYNYSIQAFNAYGIAIHMPSVSVTLCNK